MRSKERGFSDLWLGNRDPHMALGAGAVTEHFATGPMLAEEAMLDDAAMRPVCKGAKPFE